MIKTIKTSHIILITIIVGIVLRMAFLNHNHITVTGDYFFFLSAFVFLVALYRPRHVFLLLVALVPLEVVTVVSEALPSPMRLYQIVAGILVGAIALRMVMGRFYVTMPRIRRVDQLFALFAIFGVVRVFLPHVPLASLDQAVIIFVFFVIYLLTRLFAQTWEEIMETGIIFFMSGLLVALYGLAQNWFSVHEALYNTMMVGRPNATFAEADWLGMFLVTLLALYYVLQYYMMTMRKQNTTAPLALRKHTLWWDMLAYGMAVILYATLLITVARSAWLGAGAILVVFFGCVGMHFGKKILVKNIIATVVVMVIAYGSVMTLHLSSFAFDQRALSTTSGLQTITIACKEHKTLPAKISSLEDLVPLGCRHIDLEEIAVEKSHGAYVTEIDRPDPNINLRLTIYKKSLTAIRAHWLVGYGWGRSGSILGMDPSGTALNASNVFLEITLATGIIGLFTFCFVLLLLTITALRQCMRHRGDVQSVRGMFVILLLMSFLVPNIFNAGLLMGYVWVIFALMQAMSTIKQ